jgi:hypothetical protein
MTKSKQKVINKHPKYIIKTYRSEKIKWIFEIYNGKTLIEKMAGYHTEDIAFQAAKELIREFK